MKVIIFSCNTGGGHLSVAKALKEELNERNIECDIKNALDFIPKTGKLFWEGGHSLLYLYMPKVYGAGYDKEVNKKKKTKMLFEKDLPRYAPKMAKYIKANGYDTAICVHEFPGIMLSYARKKKKLDIRQYFVATDYTCSPGVQNLNMDTWFIPKGLSEVFSTAGIDRSKLYESGIPVSSWCYSPLDKKEVKEKLGIATDRTLILIGAGSIGCGPLDKLAVNLCKDSDEQCTIAVLCGKNKKLLTKINKVAEEGKLIAIPYTTNMRYWMSAADLFLTKPGGLSSTESATMGLPMVLMGLVPGLEERNMNYFAEHGYAVAAKSVDDVYEAAKSLYEDSDKMVQIQEKQRQAFSDNAAVTLINHIMSRE